MKQLITLFAVSAALTITGCAKEKEDIYPDVVNPSPTNPNNPGDNTTAAGLPSSSKTFLNTHFSGLTVKKVKTETEGSGSHGSGAVEKYEVELSDGTELDFDASGACISIKRESSIPDGALPANIVAWVKGHHPGKHIYEWELKSNKQEVELSNKIKIIFDRNGYFVKYD